MIVLFYGDGNASYYYNPLYEVSNGVPTKYYYFGGMRIAMRVNGTLSYVHTDHLGSTVLTTNGSGGSTGDEGYYAFGRDRHTNNVSTEHRFTGQKTDGSGLMYFNARYFDPELGQFVSPDTIVPDATNVMDYNRYMYARGHAMNANDPTGHCIAQGQTGWDSTSNIQCNFYAFQIAQQGGLDYIHEHFGGGWNSVDEWLKIAQSDPNLGLDFMKQHGEPLYQNWCTRAGMRGQAGCGGAYVENAPPNPMQEYISFIAQWYNPMWLCAKSIHGACGISKQRSTTTTGLGGKYGIDFYVDEDGQFALLGTIGGGAQVALIPEPGMLSSSNSYGIMPGSKVGDVSGWGISAGGSVALIKGMSVDLAVPLSGMPGAAGHPGFSLGAATGLNAEAHLFVTYSYPFLSGNVPPR